MVFEGAISREHSVLLASEIPIDSPEPSTWPSPIFSSDAFEQMMLPDLCGVTHHREQYLLLKVITKTDTVIMKSAAFGMEDDKNVLFLKSSPDDEEKEMWDTQELEVDSDFIVKEPRVELEDDGYCTVQYDYRTGVLFLAHGSELIPFPWRKEVTVSVNGAVFWN
ncbi:uncharacterized protein N7483_008947 [Penicillium malachiteum]|uniref:uncharacterized protein n=1 Tax=Penicillium malachiteum TaxID=1324776 RepID=UPI002548EB8A|nr:uncharacterized protein N7483_008947 [Penicillium malachiteum]KAJ5721013.1 hypothetical protein N7483_008947 [Penicillium malachiteum]